MKGSNRTLYGVIIIFFTNAEKSPSLFALPQPLLQSLSLRPWACKLAVTVEQTAGYNFSFKGKKKKENSSLSNQVHNSPFKPLFEIYILASDFIGYNGDSLVNIHSHYLTVTISKPY